MLEASVTGGTLFPVSLGRRALSPTSQSSPEVHSQSFVI